MTAVKSAGPLEIVRATPGLSLYLEKVERRLDELIAPPAAGSGADAGANAAAGVNADAVGRAAAQALHSGGKRLRPLLTFLCSAPDREAPVGAGVAVELMHLASLVHDDLIDDAELRRGAPSIWSAFGERVARASGDALFALAFSELARESDPAGLALLAETALALAEGEAKQREQRFDPELDIDLLIERCASKTGALFSAACRLGTGDPASPLGAYGLDLGIAFQVVDDVLDCAAGSDESGKTPGADLAGGVATVPLLLAAEVDRVVRSALAGEASPRKNEDALKRVAASGALERAREIAREYARSACKHLDGHPRSRELRALARAAAERTS